MNQPIWRTELRNISGLKDFPENPRQITENDFERLKDSIKEFGLAESPAIDTDNTILAGHMRIRAWRKLYGNKGKIEVRVPDRPLTEEERKKYVLVSNHVKGDWDIDILANWDNDFLLSVGFKPEELGIVGYQEEEKPKKKKKLKECPKCGHEL